MPSLNTGNAILSNPIKVDSSYNVGIGGAASGSFKLQVTGTTNLTGALTGTSASFSSTLSAMGTNIQFNLDGTFGTNYYTMGFGGVSNGFNRISGGTGTTDGLYITSATGRDIAFRTNGSATTSMLITSGGLVGIQNLDPSAFVNSSGFGNLVVGGGAGETGITIYSGTTGSSGLMFADATSGSGAYTGYIVYRHATDKMEIATGGGTPRLTIESTGAATFTSSVGATQFSSQGGRGTSFGYKLPDWQIYNTTSGNRLAFSNYSADLLTITSGGNVEIGNASRAAFTYLALINDANTNGGVIAIARSAGQFLNSAGAGDMIIGNSTGENILFGNSQTGTTEYMRITSAGNVCIGLTATNIRLGVRGADTGTSNYTFYTDNGATQLLSVRNDGLIYTGVASASPYNNTYSNAANTYIGADGVMGRSTSSLKYKENVIDYKKGLAEVMQLRAVYYTSKNPKEQGQFFAGLIAEEVHELGLTEFVQYAEDGTPDALAYQNMVALAFKAIQELNQTVQNQKQQINSLINR